MRANEDLRREIGARGLRQYQVADEMGMLEGNFSRLLRRELDSEKKRMVFDAILSASSKQEV
jgi:hypothetical protein